MKVQNDSLLVALVVASVIVGQQSFLLNEPHESQILESSCIKSAIGNKRVNYIPMTVKICKLNITNLLNTSLTIFTKLMI